MDIETSNAIKLFFPNPSLVQVMFEAIANAFDAGATEISVQIGITSFNAPASLRISVTDNGSGFTEDSFERFRRLLNPQDSFHKGLGRLVYLKYFQRVEITSTWGKTNRRRFVFSESFKGESDNQTLETESSDSTTLVFTNFIGDRIKSYDDIKPGALKGRIIDQFLPTLHEWRRQGRSFLIRLDLQTSESNSQKDFFSGAETVTPADLPTLTEVQIQDPLLDAYEGVEMFYRVESGMGQQTFLIAASIDGRTIPIQLLQPGAVPLNNSVIFLFSSKLWQADASRQKLVLPETISESDLQRVLRREVGKVLDQSIPVIQERNAKTQEKFEERFPHLLGLFEKTTVGLIDREEALDIAQRKFFKAQKEVLQCEKLDDATFEKSLDLSSRTLTEYILYRDLIIRKLKEMSASNSEAEIHNLVVPRYEEFKGTDLVHGAFRNNAWLLDDKFMSFHTILSEAQMDDVVAAITQREKSGVNEGRPDITMIFSANPAECMPVEVVVVELKRITDDEKDNQYVINQLLGRARKLVAHCPNIQRVWYYAVIQINNEMEESLLQQRFIPLFSKGKVFYNEFITRKPDGMIAPTPLFIMSFDAIIGDAESRNHTFLEILRSGMKQLAADRTATSTTSSPVTTP